MPARGSLSTTTARRALAAGKGGNLLLSVGPQPDGQLPPRFVERAREIGKWMEVHGELIYGSEPGEVCEFIAYGGQVRKSNSLHLVIRFWDGRLSLTLAGLEARVNRAVLLTTGRELELSQTEDHLTVMGLPREARAHRSRSSSLSAMVRRGPDRGRRNGSGRVIHGA